MRRWTALALALVALALAAVVVGAPAGESAGDVSSAPVDDDASPTLVTVGDAQVWPYVASERSFDRPASSLNVVVEEDPVSVRRYLAREREWNRSNDEWSDGWSDETSDPAVLDSETVPWRDAPGATRYAYVASDGWVTERYQLHRGDYFGSRYHVRAYGPRDGDWTAMQAHVEHWDWFTITHTVDSVENAQRHIEAEFLGNSGFSVRRVHHGNGDSYDADGWTTVVVLALTPLVARKRLRAVAGGRNRRRAALAASLAALPLVVRIGGVLFERYLPSVAPGVVVAVWYSVLVVGVPLAAYAFGRRLPATEAGALGGLGLGVGVLLDYAYLGVGVLPIPVAAHRAVVVAAVALVAAGARPARRWTPLLRAGAGLWVVAVVAGHLV